MELNYYLQEENRRCWMNFLSCLNTVHWKMMKKETIIWDLNTEYSLKFIEDVEFRTRIVSSTTDPSQQIEVSPQLIQKNRVLKDNSLFKVYSIDLSMESWIGSFQALNKVTVLNLSSSCIRELIIGPTVKTLILNNCFQLEYVNIAPDSHLENLYIRGTKTRIRQYFPFQQLKSLVLSITSPSEFDFTEALLPKLTILGVFSEKLLTGDDDDDEDEEEEEDDGDEELETIEQISLPPLHLPNLETLICCNLTLQDICGCIRLHSLKLNQVKILNGLSPSLYNQLTTFHFRGNLELNRYCCFPEYPLIHIHQKNWKYEKNDLFTEIILYETVKNISFCELNEKESKDIVIHTLPNQQYSFHRVNLSNMKWKTIEKYFIFRNTMQLILDGCQIEDVSLFRHIPYLSLSRCTKIQNLTVLGGIPRKYLDLSNCTQLLDRELISFSQVEHLNISACNMIMNLSGLTENKEIIARECQSLEQVKLYGKNYRLIDLSWCSRLRTFRLPNGGKLEFLKLRYSLLGRTLSKEKTSDAIDKESIFTIKN